MTPPTAAARRAAAVGVGVVWVLCALAYLELTGGRSQWLVENHWVSLGTVVRMVTVVSWACVVGWALLLAMAAARLRRASLPAAATLLAAAVICLAGLVGFDGYAELFERRSLGGPAPLMSAALATVVATALVVVRGRRSWHPSVV